MTKKRRSQPEIPPQAESEAAETPEVVETTATDVPLVSESVEAPPREFVEVVDAAVDPDDTLTLERPVILDAPTLTDLPVVTRSVEERPPAAAAVYTPPPQDDLSDLLSKWSPGSDRGTDIDAALAAVSSLSDLVAEQEAAEEARAEARRPALTVYKPTLPAPPMSVLKRGSLGSLVPALLLMGGGAWLTFMLTSGVTVDPLLVAALLIGGIALSLLAHWLGTRRWSRGALFTVLLIAAIAGVIAFSLQPGGIDLVRGWPLLLAGVGVALALAGVLARPIERRAFIPAVLLILAGALGLAFTGGYAPADLLPTIAPYAPVGLAVLAVVWIAPLIFKRRG
jgi:hypothetical protein